jgi:TolB-like protein
MADKQETLFSWKEIAAYLNRTERTCQRLERGMGLPVHRLDGSPKARVFAYPKELDAWLSEMIHERERRRKTRRLLFLLPALVIAGAAVILDGVLGGRKPAPDATPVPAEPSVAVLVHDLILEPGREHLPDGIAEAVRSALSRVRELRVTGKTSSDAVRDRKLDVREVGRLLGVKNVLELGVQLARENLRITAQLVNAEDGFVLWSETYDKRTQDIFGIEDEITRAIMDQLKIKLAAGEAIALAKAPTTNLEAYDLYLKGRYHVGRPRPDAQAEALRFFEEALSQDPNFALPYVGIAQAYMNMQTLFMRPATEVCPKAKAAVKRALELDPDLAEAHAIMAWVQFLFDFDLEAADKSFRRALDLKPGDALTRGMYAYSLSARRRFEEARREIKSALAMDPLIPVLYGYSIWIHLFGGRNEDVLEEFSQVQRIEPDLEGTLFGAAMAYLNLGRLKESVETFQRARLVPHYTGRPEAGLAVAYLKLGDRRAAEALYVELVEKWKKSRFASPVHLAWVAAALGNLDAASDWLELAVKEHDPSVVVLQVTAEASAPDVARDPRLLAILDRLHLPH